MASSITIALIVVIGWLISVCFHEFAHALTAFLCGDKSVKSKGYLSFNPFVYTDVNLSIILPTILILIGGIGLPGASVRIREDLIRNRFLMSLVAAAGPFATFLWIIGMVVVIRSGLLPDVWSLAFCFLLSIEIFVLILNLLPIPGLDGFGIIEPFFSHSLREKVKPYYKHGFAILILLLWVIPQPTEFLWIMVALGIHIAGIPWELVVAGEQLYRKGSFPVAAVVLVVAGVAYYFNKNKNFYNEGIRLITRGECLKCIERMNKVLAVKQEPKAYRLIALSYSELWIQEKRKLLAAGLTVPKHDEKEMEQGIANELTADESVGNKSNGASSNYLNEAISAIDKAIALSPDPEFFVDKALIYQQMGKGELALQYYEKAWVLDKTNKFCALNYFQLLRDRGELESAYKIAEESVANIPGAPELLFQKAVALASLERVEEAYICVDNCLKQGYRTEQSLHLKLLLKSMLGKYDPADPELKEYQRKANPQLQAELKHIVDSIRK